MAASGKTNMTNQASRAVIVGCGLMGADIAAIFVHAGWRLQLVDSNPAAPARASARMARAVTQLGGEIDHRLYSFVSTIKEVVWDDVTIVIETVSEDLAIKQAVFAELDRHVPARIPIGSNSSGQRITDIAAHCTSAHRMANAHFFLPAHLVPLVELAKGERTSSETLEALKQIFTAVGRKPVTIQKDLPGFLANRIQHAMMREAFSLIDQGLATPEDVDTAVRYGFGFRYAAAGPIMQKEIAGLETQLAAAKGIYGSLCNDPEPAPVLYKLVEQGRYGAKSLAGFWDWTEAQVTQERERFESSLGQAAQMVMASASAYPVRRR